MEVSKSTGKFAGKLIKGLTVAPKATTSKFKQIGHNLSEGYREVVPAKPEKPAKVKKDNQV
jgi:hypothetical protein